MNERDLGEEYRQEMDALMGQLTAALPKVVGSIDERIALPPEAGEILADFQQPLPDKGNGAAATIERLIELNNTAGGNVVGPKSYHFVIGGSTPAALAADLLATAYEAITYTWVLSPTGVEMETQGLNWLQCTPKIDGP